MVKHMLESLLAFMRDEEGLTMVEYAVAGGLITLTAVSAFTALGSQVAAKISSIATVVGNAGGGAK